MAALEVRSASAARACAGRERARRAAHAPLGARRRALVTVPRARSGVQPWLAAGPHGAQAVAAALPWQQGAQRRGIGMAERDEGAVEEERARRVTRAIITPLSPAWRGHRPLLGRGGPGARAPGAYDPPGQARWPGARGGVRVPRERGARVARRARPASRGWLRSRRTAWWARTPRPSVSRVEGRERRARRVRPLSLSLLVFVGARESSRGMPTRAPAALLRVRQRSSRTTACGRRTRR